MVERWYLTDLHLFLKRTLHQTARVEARTGIVLYIPKPGDPKVRFLKFYIVKS